MEYCVVKAIPSVRISTELAVILLAFVTAAFSTVMHRHSPSTPERKREIGRGVRCQRQHFKAGSEMDARN